MLPVPRPIMSETRELLLRWHDGDQAALLELVQQDAEWIAARVRRRMGPLLRRRAETQDIVQNTLLQVLHDGPRFVLSDRDQLRKLLACMVENVLRVEANHQQAQKRDVRREAAPPAAAPGAAQSVLSLDPPADATRPSEAAGRAEQRDWVRLALELLEPEDRNVVLWREYHELPFAEIAQRLGVAEDAARMRYNRALPKLAKQLMRLRAGQLDAVLDEREGGAPS
jgi:RNA polymerase sigma-70 factor (ECF subfamily)